MTYVNFSFVRWVLKKWIKHRIKRIRRDFRDSRKNTIYWQHFPIPYRRHMWISASYVKFWKSGLSIGLTGLRVISVILGKYNLLAAFPYSISKTYVNFSFVRWVLKKGIKHRIKRIRRDFRDSRKNTIIRQHFSIPYLRHMWISASYVEFWKSG